MPPVFILDSDNTWKEVTRTNFNVRDLTATKTPDQAFTLDSDNTWKPWFATDDGTIILVGCEETATTGDTVTVDVPTGAATGDYLIAIVAVFTDPTTVNVGQVTTSTSDWILPAGWTGVVDKVGVRRDSSDPCVLVAYREVDGTEPASYDFELNQTVTTNRIVGNICAFRNVDAPIVESATVSYDEPAFIRSDASVGPLANRDVIEVPAIRVPGESATIVISAVNGQFNTTDEQGQGASLIDNKNAGGTIRARWIDSETGDGEAFTNLITSPFDITGADWTDVGGTSGTNNAGGQDLAERDSYFLESGATGRHGVEQDISVVAGETYYIYCLADALPDSGETREGGQLRGLSLTWTEGATEVGQTYEGNQSSAGNALTVRKLSAVGAGFDEFYLYPWQGRFTVALAKVTAAATGTATLGIYGGTITGSVLDWENRAAVTQTIFDEGAGNIMEVHGVYVGTDPWVDPRFSEMDGDDGTGLLASDGWVLPRFLTSSTTLGTGESSTDEEIHTMHVAFTLPASGVAIASRARPRFWDNRGIKPDSRGDSQYQYPAIIPFTQQTNHTPEFRLEYSKTSGKWYWEVTNLNNFAGSAADFRGLWAGICHAHQAQASGVQGWSIGGVDSRNRYAVSHSGSLRIGSSLYAAISATIGQGDTIEFAWDADAGTLAVYQAGVLVDSDILNRDSASYVVGEPYVPFCSGPTLQDMRLYFRDQTALLTQTPPGGFTPIGD
ncbi:MAG: hypothetical protein QNJ97_17845 [Myxococcota bacterium]|nr:hypothetical protein [Myxococcota bacterium]